MCSDIIQIGGIDFKIEVAKEVDFCRPNQDLKDVRCDKNPGHGEFIPFHELNLNHLPPACRTVDVLHQIKNIGKQVVRIIVKDDSGRPIACGSGFVLKRYNKYLILTNNHVIKDGREAKNSVIEFNFDSHTSEKICCKGVDVFYTCPIRDTTEILFEPGEFLNTMGILDIMMVNPIIEITYKNDELFKHVSQILPVNDIFSVLINRDPNHPEIKDISVRFIDGTVSKLISPYITFHPIPDNIQSFSHQMSGYHRPKVELVPHEGEYTIPLQGEIIYSFNTITIKLSQSLTKQEAENCLIYFPGGSISRGTGLYFDVDTNYVTSYINQMDGEDRDMCQRVYGSSKCFVMFKPIPEEISLLMKEVTYYLNEPMVAIGHPHGAPKMVTFGKYLGETLENNAGRETKCVKYSCNTCSGSSGSPVYFTQYIHQTPTPHFAGKPVTGWERQVLGVDNVNMAWAAY